MAARKHLFAGKGNLVSDRPDQEYSVYTSAFDHELPANEVPPALKLSGVLTGASGHLEISSIRERIRLADQAYSDAKAGNAQELLAETLGDNPKDISISILLDQSGSMVNRAITLAGQMKLLAEVCETAGAELSILGFTTMGWHGGHSRHAWLNAGAPPYPGRIASLLHIVYKDKSRPLQIADWEVLLDPNCFFENIDGEALQWAFEKIEESSRTVKILLVVSDGAPVDDASLSANGSGFLERHLLQVIGDIESGDKISLGALGMNHRVERYYRCCESEVEGEVFLQKTAAILPRLISAASQAHESKTPG